MNNDEIWQRAAVGWQHYADTLGALESQLDRQQWLAVLDRVMNCKGKIAVTGVGTSGIAARKIAHMFSCIEFPAVFLSATDAAHGDIGFLQRTDLLIMLSRGGHSDELTRLLPVVKSKGATLISVTENPHSALAKAADQLLLLPKTQEIDPLNMLATTSFIMMLALFDGMMINLMASSGFDKETLLAVHPAGNVGKQLRENG